MGAAADAAADADADSDADSDADAYADSDSDADADADAYAAEEGKTHQACQTVGMCILFCLCLTILAGVIWFFNFAVRHIVREIEINRVDPTFRLHSATVSLLNNASASDFTATWDVTLVASNPNHKLDIYYDTLQAAIFYNANYRSDSYTAGVLLATKPLPPPSALRTRAETTCSFRIEAASAYIGDDVAKEISEGRARGMVRFELNLLAMYKFPSWYWTYPKFLKAWCNPVEFGFSPDNWIGTAQSSACVGNGDLSRLVLHIAEKNTHEHINGTCV